MSSSRHTDRKKHERGSKSSRHQNSYSIDSGVGSSSASDRASLGTSPDNANFYVQDQRNNLAALREALDAANKENRDQANEILKLEALLAESNRDKRSLQRENKELNVKFERVLEELDDEKRLNARFKRDSPRTDAAPQSEKRTKDEPRRYEEGSRNEKRDSCRELPVPKYEPPPTTAPQDLNALKDRFTRKERRTSISYPQSPTYAPSSYASAPSAYAPSQGSVTYASSQVTYAPAPLSYASAPTFGPRKKQPPNDGAYHHYPVNG